MTDTGASGAERPVASRVLGIDLGQRRIGVSISDTKRILATPHSVLTHNGAPAPARSAIAALVAELQVGLVVVGLPLTMAGDRGRAASAAEAEASALAAELDVPVVLHDERLTTVEAERRLRRPGRTGATSRDNRKRIDAVAATVLLQAWLDENRDKS